MTPIQAWNQGYKAGRAEGLGAYPASNLPPALLREWLDGRDVGAADAE